ncbi:type I-F CRISPR-associated protein Csy2 [Vogesella sp. AC12]|uniref:type I-F CRISPR-associated protein Csy2 n=1 Tax=Vogesella sp. AC12 TaxID=2950550 RepID=UPI00210E67BF|nr:type I-F CRISPR-associated protein Csy2 [Vogesella sp. AC12]MCQ4145186.1 type I-F CRISPR-associated protein Csy2 [Vogesella sp. AC12]
MLTNITGLLTLPHLRVQNANAISSQHTWGVPSITAFSGLMAALERKLAGAIDLEFYGVGVICHGYQAQTNGDYVQRFNLTRNPIDKDGSTAAIVEEGRIHLDITLVFGVAGDVLTENEAKRDEIAANIANIVATLRIAGGSVIPQANQPARRIKPTLQALEEGEKRAKQFRQLRRQWLPGFALLARDDLLHSHHAKLVGHNPDATLLDGWLDKSRLNHSPVTDDKGDTVWQHSRQQGEGWIVPIPVGYGALSGLHPAGSVANARDDSTPFRFVESVYSLGEWRSPHRLHDVLDLLWYPDFDEASGVYRCRNHYTAPQDTASDLIGE